MFKRFISWLYRRFVDEIYIPNRKEISISDNGGCIRISSNTHPFIEKYIVGTTVSEIKTIQGKKCATIIVNPFY